MTDVVQPIAEEQTWPEVFAERLATWQQLLPRMQRLSETVVPFEDCWGCGVPEGFCHHWGCEEEVCPFCDRYLATCQCAQEWSEAQDGDRQPDSPAQDACWQAHVASRGRVPYIAYPMRCGRCWGEPGWLVMVPNAIWRRYVEPRHRKDWLCVACFVYIVAVTIQATTQPLPSIGGQMLERWVEAEEAADQETPG